mgnify:CR=1 FL=1
MAPKALRKKNKLAPSTGSARYCLRSKRWSVAIVVVEGDGYAESLGELNLNGHLQGTQSFLNWRDCISRIVDGCAQRLRDRCQLVGGCVQEIVDALHEGAVPLRQQVYNA